MIDASAIGLPDMHPLQPREWRGRPRDRGVWVARHVRGNALPAHEGRRR